jgi:hypothetical protein
LVELTLPVSLANSKPAEPISPTSQANSKLAKPTLIVSMVADTSLDHSTPVISFVVVADAQVHHESLDEELVDYKPSPEHMDINVVYLSIDGDFIGDDARMANLIFATPSAIFEKPKDSVNHLKPLHVKGHIINGTLVHRMLVDSGAIVNLMPY